MLFNSLEFAIFLPIVFALFWFVAAGKTRLQNAILLIASCVFYMFLIPEYILVLFLAIIIDYFAGIWLERTTGKKRKWILILSVVSTCMILFVFKYYNFFIDNTNHIAKLIGWNYSITALQIALPIGLSFHTFQSLSYVIDVYKNEQKAEKDFLTYSVYVMFFPQLVAGPIERARNLFPQFHRKKIFDYEQAADGMRQILWGLFTKVVIADNCAVLVDTIFRYYGAESGSTLWVGAVLFSIQIYCDFSGYSNMALGIAKLFGFNLMQNFNYPYFSRDMAEFWRKWHISLTTWFRDYLYLPIGGSRGGTFKVVRNTFIIFLVSGFWHGANWTFVIWGFLNALYFLPLLLSKRHRKHTGIIAEGRVLPSFRELIGMGVTFFLATIAWVFFRADNLHVAVEFLKKMFSVSALTIPKFRDWILGLFILAFIVVEWLGRTKQHPLEISALSPWKRRSIYSMVFAGLFFYAVYNANQFIYFQF